MKQTLILLVFALILAFNAHSQELNVGDKAPNFISQSDNGSDWNVDKYLGKKFIVVYFYPAAMTGGCTKQACAYRDFKKEISSADAVIVGVSGDNVEGLKVFKKAYGLNFTLLSDESGEIATKFGVPMRDGGTITKEVNGKSYDLTRGTTASRWTFIIDKSGKIAYKNTSVDATKDTEQVLEFIKSNS
jgi:peroxiredoxin Q/BCP